MTRRRAVLLVLALALAVRVALVILTPHFGLGSIQGTPAFDSRDYDKMARRLLAGGGYLSSLPPRQVFRPPGYPAFLSAVYAIFGTGGHRLDVVRVLQALLGTVSVGLLGLLARRLLGFRVALVAMVLAAVYVPGILVGESVLSEALFVPLVLGATLCALHARGEHHRRRWAVATGLLAAACAYTRGNGLVLIPVFALVAWAPPLRSMRGARVPALIVVASLLALLPWTVRNAVVTHRLVPVNDETGFTLAGTYSADVAHSPGVTRARWLSPSKIGADHRQLQLWHKGRITDEEAASRLKKRALHYARAHPGYVATVIAWNTIRLAELAPSETTFTIRSLGYESGWLVPVVVSFWLVGLLALAGIGAIRRRGVPVVIWLIPLGLWLGVVPFNSQPPRFRVPLDPFLLMLAAAALCALSARRTLARSHGPPDRA